MITALFGESALPTTKPVEPKQNFGKLPGEPKVGPREILQAQEELSVIKETHYRERQRHDYQGQQ
jgi:hypothetical protein